MARAEEFRGDSNVGGPDGDPPPYTIGTLTLPYFGDDARRWLWHEMDSVRLAYMRRFHDDVE